MVGERIHDVKERWERKIKDAARAPVRKYMEHEETGEHSELSDNQRSNLYMLLQKIDEFMADEAKAITEYSDFGQVLYDTLKFPAGYGAAEMARGILDSMSLDEAKHRDLLAVLSSAIRKTLDTRRL